MNDNNRKNTTINWYPGHMAKTKREMKEKLALIDLVYEVIDARMPLSSKIPDLDELVLGKPRIVIMTKYDLCDKEKTDSIVSMYQSNGCSVVPVDLVRGTNVSQIITLTEKVMAEMNELRKKKGLKPRNIRVLIVGVPNVGKSTLINRLVSKKAVVTGNRPGVTKSLGWIRIHKHIELLDSPGILWPKLEDQRQAHILASFSSIKEELLDMEDLSRFIYEELREQYPGYFEKRYHLDQIDDFDQLVKGIAHSRGCLQKGGLSDYDKVYSTLVNDLKEGRLGPVTLDKSLNL